MKYEIIFLFLMWVPGRGSGEIKERVFLIRPVEKWVRSQPMNFHREMAKIARRKGIIKDNYAAPVELVDDEIDPKTNERKFDIGPDSEYHAGFINACRAYYHGVKVPAVTVGPTKQ